MNEILSKFSSKGNSFNLNIQATANKQKKEINIKNLKSLDKNGFKVLINSQGQFMRELLDLISNIHI